MATRTSEVSACSHHRRHRQRCARPHRHQLPALRQRLLHEGRHSFKTGYEWRRTFINSFINSGHRGELVFDTLSDFLSGTLDSKSVPQMATEPGTPYQNGSGAYFMDAWHMTPKISSLTTACAGITTALSAPRTTLSASSTCNDSHGETAGRCRRAFVALSQGLAKLCAAFQPGRRSDGQRQAGAARSASAFITTAPRRTSSSAIRPITPTPANAGPAFNYIGFAYPAGHDHRPRNGTPIFGGASNYSPQQRSSRSTRGCGRPGITPTT